VLGYRSEHAAFAGDGTEPILVARVGDRVAALEHGRLPAVLATRFDGSDVDAVADVAWGPQQELDSIGSLRRFERGLEGDALSEGAAGRGLVEHDLRSREDGHCPTHRQ